MDKWREIWINNRIEERGSYHDHCDHCDQLIEVYPLVQSIHQSPHFDQVLVREVHLQSPKDGQL